MEWTPKQPPKVGDLRIRRSFALLPVQCLGTKVWLELYYVFEEFYSPPYEDGDCWLALTTLSRSQFNSFQKDLALGLTSPSVNTRKFAEMLQSKKED